MPSFRGFFMKTIILWSLLMGALSTRIICAGQTAQLCVLSGTVTLNDSGQPVPYASVTIVELARSVMTDAQGNYRLSDIPAGAYNVASHMHALASPIKHIAIAAGQSATLDFQLSISTIRNEITITSSGRQETAFDAFQAVTTVDSLRLSEQSGFGLGDAINNESGVHKRSFGPGSSRPVVRGFDGDRVLVLNDGLSTGTLSSQSGEHAEPVDAANLDRVEVVKGPATLLYGSNAVGGVINMVTEHHMIHENRHPGLRGQATVIGGSNNNQAAAHANAEYGAGNWLFWSGGSRQVASDYSSPQERIDNSKTRMISGNAGVGWFSEGPFFNIGYSFNKGRLGVPFAGAFHSHGEEEEHDSEDSEEHEHALVDETFTWQNIRLSTGTQHLNSHFDELKIAANFSRWMHKELEDNVTATAFDNKLFNLRTTIMQHPYKSLSGTSGFHLFHRDYRAEGEEALAPPVTGNGIAFFTLQEIDLKTVRLQFGGRLDRTTYHPEGLAARSFTGVSGAAGIHIPLWKDGAVVANYTHSYRAPAIDELYNNGPHIGNLAFEMGNPNLKREITDGIDLSLRHENARVDASANFYYYRLGDFVYMRLTGGSAHGLRIIDFSQADSRFLGGEAQLNVALRSNLWLLSGLDAVNAELTDTGKPLPRIPPLRGKIGFDAGWRGLSFRPELIMAADQNEIYPTETRTPGYTVLNLTGSFTLVRSNLMHMVSVTVFNAGDRLYKNHLSFIKDLAPEMGRGVRVTYSVRFF